MKNVLIIQTAFIGDVILSTAVLESLHVCFPDARLTMLVREGNESLLMNHPFLHEVLIWKKKSRKNLNLIQTIFEVRRKKYDAVINLQRFFSSGLITATSGAKIKSGFNKNPLSFLFTDVVEHAIGNGMHEVERNSLTIKKWCQHPVNLPRLYPGKENETNVTTYKLKKYITIAPSSVWFTKQLPEEKWIELVANAPRSIQIYLIGGGNDSELCQRILESAGNSSAMNLAGKLSLLDTAALMKDAVMNYVNDSGPQHLASAMNAPVTTFYCSTIPEFGFGPLSTNSTIIEPPVKLECRPCGLHGKKECPLGHFKCGHSILVPSLPN